MAYDFIIVGAGIAGITAAEQLANIYNKKVLLIDKNDHIGGNCYDYYNEDGILVHKYGPHIFHTDNEKVYNYLSLFTGWNIYNHKVVCNISDTLLPIPFNMISIEKGMPEYEQDITTALITEHCVNDRIPLSKLKESKNPDIQKLVKYISDNIYFPYIQKQYGLPAEQLDTTDIDTSVVISYDCRYYHDAYQATPSDGYTVMFENMLANHNITILLEKDYKDILSVDYDTGKIYCNEDEFTGEIIFTGAIDEFFNYKYGMLPYRSSVFMNETVNEIHFQENATITYPDKYHFTQITEYKYLTGQQAPDTTIQFEFPVKYNPEFEESSIPYYPIPERENMVLYEKYEKLTEDYPQITFIGRLAQYKYIKMDEIVDNTLKLISEKMQEE